MNGASPLEAVLGEGIDEKRIVPAPSNPMGVAREIVSHLYERDHDQHLHHHRGNFYTFDGACWPEAEERGIRSAIYQFLEDAWYEKEVKGVLQLVPWEPTFRKVNDVVDAIRAIVHLDGVVEAPAWTTHTTPPAREIVVMDNGLLHVPTRTLLPHSPDYWNHHRLPYAFDADAPLPVCWLDFLHELWPTDPASIDALQEIIGYILAGGTEQQKIFLLVGPKRGGKGTIGRVITGLLGRHNYASPTMAGLATNFGTQELIGKPLGLISDARLSSRADSSIVVERLLSISGEDSLTIDRKYKDPWTGRLPTRFMVLTNEIPQLIDASGALASRFVMLVLTRSFYGAENPRLTDELLQEAPGILNWALLGLDRLMARGHFLMPSTSTDAIRQMEDLSAPVGAFIRQQCIFDAEAEIPVDSMWAAWKAWCTDENRHPGTKATFGRDLKATAPNVRRARPRTERDARHWVYAGIRIRSVADEPEGTGGSMANRYDHRDQADQNGASGPGGHSGHGNSALQHPYANGHAACKRCGSSLSPDTRSNLCSACRTTGVGATP